MLLTLGPVVNLPAHGFQSAESYEIHIWDPNPWRRKNSCKTLLRIKECRGMLHRVYGVHFGTFLFRFLFNKYKITTQESRSWQAGGAVLELD